MPCEDELPINCETCYEVTFTDCNEIKITTTNLVAGTNYHLYVIDKFNKLRNTTVTIAGDHSFTIDTTQFPAGLFNSYAGKFEIFLSTTDTGEDYDVSLTISGTSYNCVIATFNIAANETCCESDLVCKTVCEQIEGVSAQHIADCLEASTGDKLEDVKALICEVEPVILRNSDNTYNESVTSSDSPVILADTAVTQSDGTSESVPYNTPVVCQQFQPALVKNSAGVTVYSLLSGQTVTISKYTVFKSNGSTVYAQNEFNVNTTLQPVTITNSEGVTKYTKDAGDTQAIPRHIIYKSDGVTQYANPEFDVNTTLAPVLIKTSDGSTTVYTKDAGESQNIPKHNIYKSDGTTLYGSDEFNQNRTIPGVTITDTDGVTQYVKDGGDTFTCTPISRVYAYPSHSGQTVSYATRDDASVQTLYFSNLPSGKLVARSSFLLLVENNIFGNTNRFTDSLGAQLYGVGNAAIANYVIDHFTGLGWIRTFQTASTWATAISNAAASTAGGFNNWFVPNQPQMRSLLNFGATGGSFAVLNYAPFNSLTAATLLTSTTNQDDTTAYISVVTNGAGASDSKSNSRQYLLCRKHF